MRQEYDRRRLSAESSRDERVEAVYQAVPEIRRIDGEIESFGINSIKDLPELPTEETPPGKSE